MVKASKHKGKAQKRKKHGRSAAAKKKRRHKQHAKKRSPPHLKAPGLERFEHKPLPEITVPDWVVHDILAKRDLLASEGIAKHLVLRFVRKNPGIARELHHEAFKRTARYEQLKKWVRQELRVLVGMFILETKPEKLLDADTETILRSHQSTVERLPHYAGLYDELFGERKPEVVLDLCCGLNPASYEHLGCSPVYYAIDVSPQLTAFLNTWFLRRGITGRAECADVTTMTAFPDADTVFLFKAMDVLERVKYGFGEHLLDVFRERRVIVSFARATMSGKRSIKDSKRSWVERWAGQNERQVRVVDTPNERFYVIG